MKKNIILAVSCLINATVWAESSDSLSTLQTTPENTSNGDTTSLNDQLEETRTSDNGANSAENAIKDASVISTDHDNPQSLDSSVQLPRKSPRAYGDSAYVQLGNRSSSFKRPEIEFGIVVGGSGSYIPVNEKLIDISGIDEPQRFKFHLSGEGLSTGMNVYAGYRRGNNTFGGSITGYVDTHTLKNYDHKRDINSGQESPALTFLTRSYTLEFAARAGYYFDDIHLYGKLGIICSAFQYKFRNPSTDSRKNLTAWGGSIGTGVQKPFSLPAIGDAKIGLEYNYQIYESLRPVITYPDHTDTSKFRPRYHTGFLTISKTF